QKKKLMEENKDLQLCYLEQKQQLEELKEQVKHLTKEDNRGGAELSEAVLLTKVEKPQKEGDLMFLEEDDNIHKDLEHSMKELQLTHMETVQELEKTRNMLIVQHKITKDYQVEVEAVTRKMEGLKKDCELKLEQYGHLLDKKSERIRKLEAQLSDIFYGTKPRKTRREILTSAPVHEFDQPLCLERGQNLLEINISKVILSSGAVQAFGDHELATFCTYGFYDFELEITPLAYGHTPSFDFTSQYLVWADERLLKYLQENSVTLEVHHACGIDHETVATCQLKLWETLENNAKIYSTAHLVGTEGHVRDYGTLEYWMRLRLPMEQAIGHYKQRSKALGYITSNFRDREQPSQQQILRTAQVITSTDGSLNEVHITVKCCNNLQSRKNNLQPDPYVVYKFFDFEDHDTPIIPSSNNPQIDDHMCFQVPMNADLDRYLKTESLSFYVFDEGETDKSAYIGKAKVPLISLAHDRSISGAFELTHPERLATGTITVELKWKLVYRPPSGSTVSADFVNDIQNEKSVATELQAEEQMETPDVSPSFTSSVTKPTPKPRQHAAQAEKKISFPDLSTTQMEVKEMAQEIQQEKDRLPLPKGPLTDQSSVTSEGKTKVTEELQTEELGDEQKDGDVESIPTDSDDCVIISNPISKLKATEKIVIEILSLHLTDSRIASDETIKQLFIECRLHNVIAEETPLSLPKPKIGQKIHYHFGCVIHVDKANNSARRDYLKSMLLEPDLHTDRLRFAVVSDPLPCEQDLECQDIGFAYVSLREILREGRDIIEQDIDFFDSQDAKAAIGKLTVSVEALQVLRSVHKECM
ncbi:PREDICTED: protein fantom-like, partial [Pterocles gutturalis]|uniref:protein fantom-like n=1 Tax=Pterocles gutturalis TaxID=240206 RepID=UPI000528EB7B